MVRYIEECNVQARRFKWFAYTNAGDNLIFSQDGTIWVRLLWRIYRRVTW